LEFTREEKIGEETREERGERREEREDLIVACCRIDSLSKIG
jgi:hypothetical protein